MLIGLDSGRAWASLAGVTWAVLSFMRLSDSLIMVSSAVSSPPGPESGVRVPCFVRAMLGMDDQGYLDTSSD